MGSAGFTVCADTRECANRSAIVTVTITSPAPSNLRIDFFPAPRLFGEEHSTAALQEDSRMFRALSIFFVALAFAASVSAQGQAINGTIEGTVTDESGAVLPGVTV